LYKEKIAIIGENGKYEESIKNRLLNEGFEVDMYSYGSNPEKLAEASVLPDLILIVVQCPEDPGINTCIMLREKVTAPIFLLSYQSSDSDKILGYSIGADAYVTFPVNISVLIAQINAAFRRRRLQSTHSAAAPEPVPNANEDYLINYPDLKININTHTVVANYKVISLSYIEFSILALLAGNPDRVFYKSQIFNNIWDTNSILMGDDKTVTVHISNLRKKIEVDPLRPKYIITVRGIGYKFATPHED